MLYKFLKNKIKSKKVIVFGEIHGTKETPLILQEFFKDYLINENKGFGICMEIPKEEQGNIDNFLSIGDIKFLEKMTFFRVKTKSDGRNSKEYFDLIVSIYNLNKIFEKNINIYCIDDWTDVKLRDKNMAENILNVLKYREKRKLFVILGNFHASKKMMMYGKEFIKTCGYYLLEKLNHKMVTINLAPLQGTFYNCRIRRIRLQGKVNDFVVSHDFDHVYPIKSVAPCSFVKN